MLGGRDGLLPVSDWWRFAENSTEGHVCRPDRSRFTLSAPASWRHSNVRVAASKLREERSGQPARCRITVKWIGFGFANHPARITIYLPIPSTTIRNSLSPRFGPGWRPLSRVEFKNRGVNDDLSPGETEHGSRKIR